MQPMTNKERRRFNKIERRKQLRLQREHLQAAGAESQTAVAVRPVNQRAHGAKRDRTQAILEFGLATGDEVALYLGVHLKTVERWRKQYSLPCMRIGGRIRYRLQEVAYWASARKEGE